MDLSSLLDAAHRPGVVSDLTSLAERTISEQSGMTGLAIKGAVGTAKRVENEIIPASINRFLPLILGALQPFATEATAAAETAATGTADFGAFLASNEDRVSEALLQIADANIENVRNPAVLKLFSSIRGKANRIISPALGELGSILQRHYSAAQQK
ncbi:DUF6918 family protein [Corynebacterium caspium]|uniref:DUF6918 family protein n=1 Tax=Corynebacterium caspium TaxID=234828 RepID=UPI00037B955B|nr:hypothetical protein [Corynebacterium caspium]WKD58446.1 hypothetical protein CCASP_00035 [Corynebacterium caspium DSM 44850]